jgi:hypothetical protein
MSFLRDYALYTSGNEAPKIFHFWSGMVALSAIVSRRVGFQLGYFDIHPNLYVVLVGTPGTKKTTAMSSSKDVIRDLKDIPFSAECITKQALCKEMAEQCVKTYLDSNNELVTYTPYSIFATELSHFLGMGTAKEMIDFLTTIYDERFYNAKTKNKGNDIIVGPYITMLACTTPDWIRGWMKEDVITGGFSRRALFVYYNGARQRIPDPVITPEMLAARARCIKWGEKLQSVHGMFRITDEALEFYREWYKALDIPQDFTAGYYESKHVQMLKSAMLIALSESVDLTLQLSHLQLALDQLALIETNMRKVFEGVGRNELNAIASKIIEIVEGSGGSIGEKQLNLLMYREANAEELAKVMQHLRSTDKLVLVEETIKNSTRRRRILALPEVAAKLAGASAEPAPHPQSSQDSSSSVGQLEPRSQTAV